MPPDKLDSSFGMNAQGVRDKGKAREEAGLAGCIGGQSRLSNLVLRRPVERDVFICVS